MYIYEYRPSSNETLQFTIHYKWRFQWEHYRNNDLFIAMFVRLPYCVNCTGIVYCVYVYIYTYDKTRWHKIR